MKIYVDPPDVRSRSIGRIANELKRHAPSGVSFVSHPDHADLVVLHIIGRFEQNLAMAQRCLDRGQRYVVNQYCLRSTQKPSTHTWRILWDTASLVWSYYNLNAWIREDRGDGFLTNFYHSPLGADATAFTPSAQSQPRRFVAGTTGFDWLTEGIREVGLASAAVQREMFHLGPDLNRGDQTKHITCRVGMSDEELSTWYNQCEYVAGLRRIEGFELPCAEGILCGARPLMFDTPHYRQWFQEFGVFVPETSRAEVVERLIHIFQEPVAPIGRDEYEFAKRRFDWGTIVHEYWRRCL